MLRRTRIAKRIAFLANLPDQTAAIDNALRRIYTGGTGGSAVGDRQIPGLPYSELRRLLARARREIR